MVEIPEHCQKVVKELTDILERWHVPATDWNLVNDLLVDAYRAGISADHRFAPEDWEKVRYGMLRERSERTPVFMNYNRWKAMDAMESVYTGPEE